MRPMSIDRPIRLEAAVIGRVQGVSFRYYTVQQARQLGLVGWVANQADGSVQLVAEGPEQAIDVFAAFLQTGSPQASVERVIQRREAATGEFPSFRIRSL